MWLEKVLRTWKLKQPRSRGGEREESLMLLKLFTKICCCLLFYYLKIGYEHAVKGIFNNFLTSCRLPYSSVFQFFSEADVS